jgi:branched-chain amino acid transport system substrate-binding protein
MWVVLPMSALYRPSWLIVPALLMAAALVTSCTSGTSALQPASVGLRVTDDSAGPHPTFQVVGVFDRDGNDLAIPDPASVATPQADPTATCAPGLSIGMAGDLSGEAAEVGGRTRDGAALAVMQFNASHPSCQLTIREFDTKNADLTTLQAAKDAVADTSVIGLIGPMGSHEFDLVGEELAQAGLVAATPSAGDPRLSSHGWTNFFRAVGTDTDSAVAAGNYLARRLGSQKICVVTQDRSETIDAARAIGKTLGSVENADCRATVGDDTRLNSADVQAIASAAPDAVFFAGYGFAAGPFVSLLRKAGNEATFLRWQGLVDSDFITKAGQAARHVLAVGSWQPPVPNLQKAFRDAFGWDDGRYTPEAYELATIMVNGIASGAVTDRASMLSYFKTYRGNGFTRHYEWDERGELKTAPFWVWEVD